MQKSKGFTLIELLVVIAIIGILAAIVFVNVNSARKSAKDSAVTANLSQFQVAAEQEYGTSTSYATVCSSGAPSLAFAAASSSSGLGSAVCNDEAGTYVACVRLVNASGNAWCVDYNGVKKQITNAQCDTIGTGAGTVCP